MPIVDANAILPPTGYNNRIDQLYLQKAPIHFPNTHAQTVTSEQEDETSQSFQKKSRQPRTAPDFTCYFDAGTIRFWRVARARPTPFVQFRLSPNEYSRLYHRPSLLVQLLKALRQPDNARHWLISDAREIVVG